MTVDKIAVCKPILNLIARLQGFKFSVEEAKISDVHFHEISIKMRSVNSLVWIENINVEEIEQIDSALFRCTCHWSTVEILRA